MDQQPTAAYSHITCETDDSIMVITLNRPDKLNAYTGAMGSEIEAAFRAADIDDSVRAIIVTGFGPRLLRRRRRLWRCGQFRYLGQASAPECSATGCERFAAVRQRLCRCDFSLPKTLDCRHQRSGGRHRHHHDAADGHAHCAKGAKIGFIFARRGLVPEAGSAGFCQNW